MSFFRSPSMLYSPSHWFLKRRLKLRALSLLVAVQDHGNLQRAADALGMTQPAASKMLKELQEILGAPMVTRLHRGMQATPEGQVVTDHARNILSELNRVPTDIAALREKSEVQVSVGAIKAPALSMVPRALVEFQTRHRQARVSLLVDSSPALLEKLRREELDIAVGRLAPDLSPELFNYEELAESQTVRVVVRPGHPWLNRASIDWTLLRQATWVIPPQGSMLKLQFESIFVHQKMMPPQNLVETLDLDTIRQLLEKSSALAVLSNEVAKACKAVPLRTLSKTLSFKMQGFGLITLKNKPLSPAVAEMVQLLARIGHTHYPLKR